MLPQTDAMLQKALDRDREAVWEFMRLMRAGRPAKELRVARLYAAETWKAAMIVRQYHLRINERALNGTLAVDRLDLLREATADQMDVDMMRTP